MSTRNEHTDSLPHAVAKIFPPIPNEQQQLLNEGRYLLKDFSRQSGSGYFDDQYYALGDNEREARQTLRERMEGIKKAMVRSGTTFLGEGLEE